MAVQQELYPNPPAVQPAEHTPAGAELPPPAPAYVRWMQRVSLFIMVLFCVYLGAIMTYLPWWTAVWDHNLFFALHPEIYRVMRLGVVRGVISGIGLVDIWIGIAEAVHYREAR